jgi:hypothetical protein
MDPEKNEPIIPAETHHEDLVDIEGFDHMAHDWGERFTGWYMAKVPLDKQTVPLNYKDTDLSYTFTVADYHYQWFMPSILEFSSGTITYSDGHRRLGVFRFPKDAEGKFGAPLPNGKTQEELITLSEEEIRELVSNREVLTFEAFRIPQYGFHYLTISDHEFDELAKITDPDFAKQIQGHFEGELATKITEVKEKIEATPNYLLILRNVLDFHLTDMREMISMTGGILYIYGSNNG